MLQPLKLGGVSGSIHIDFESKKSKRSTTPLKKEMTGYPSIDKPWLDFYPTEVQKAKLEESTLYNYIKDYNSDNLDRIAIDYYGNRISYGNMLKEIDNVASCLEKIGVKEGDIVTICMVNSPETVFLMFALNKIGAVANMINGGESKSEIKHYINDSKSEIVFCLDIFQNKILEVIDELNVKKVIVAGLLQSMSLLNRIGARLVKKIRLETLPGDKRFIAWKEFAASYDGISNTVYDADAPAFITYTGGTTGGSKGVVLDNKGVMAVAEQYILAEKELYRDNIWMQVLPLFIAFGVTCSLMVPLRVGMTIITRIPMSDSITDLCRKFKPNHIVYSPAFWEAFADEGANLDLSNLIAPISGGDTLNEKTEAKIDRYLEKCGSRYKLMNGYGMTEVGAGVSVNFKHIYEFGSVGAPMLKNIIAAFDPETGKELKYGEIGEICIHTPSMMRGYLNNEEETKNIIRKHDDNLLWVHSGDLGFISERGFVHISGRIKRYTLSFYNGIAKKIFSIDIEKELLKHPSVAKCAVVPKEDELRNQVPVAFIVRSDFKEEETILKESLKGYAEENLELLYRPIDYIFVDSYPLTKIGKVDYKTMEEMVNSK